MKHISMQNYRAANGEGRRCNQCFAADMVVLISTMLSQNILV